MNNSFEITLRGVLLAIILSVILGAANTFLALKIGFVTSASIPAAVLSMGILRWFKNSNILENNMVQTGASAGEAVACGIVFTIPALVIIHYWHNFNYWENFSISFISGILGVMFSIPIRKVLVTSKSLPFPEGRAVAEVLQTNHKEASGFREMIIGSSVGGLIELLQSGLNIIASSIKGWVAVGNTLVGGSIGFSSTLIGAGYLIGFNIGLCILLGAVISWGICSPLLSTMSHVPLTDPAAVQTAASAMAGKIHNMGIGALLIAGFSTLGILIKPIYESIKLSFTAFKQNNALSISKSAAEHDIPIHYAGFASLILLILSYFLFQHLFHLETISLAHYFKIPFIFGSVIYFLLAGFIFSVIAAYFSGLIGVSASPISSIIVLSTLLITLVLTVVVSFHPHTLTANELLNTAAIAIILGSMVTGAASIANDNIQDLKVGYLIGATPWKQQVMLMIGVTASSLIVPLVMNLLFNVYGIANVLPHPGMDPTKTLAAPTSAVMAGIVQGVFSHNLPWSMFGIGAGIILALVIINIFLKQYDKQISLLGVAMGMYLPLAYSTPLFIGAAFSFLVHRAVKKEDAIHIKETNLISNKKQKSILIACGLVAGAALMDVILAIPMSLAHSPDVLNIMPDSLTWLANILGILSVFGLGMWFYKTAK